MIYFFNFDSMPMPSAQRLFFHQWKKRFGGENSNFASEKLILWSKNVFFAGEIQLFAGEIFISSAKENLVV